MKRRMRLCKICFPLRKNRPMPHYQCFVCLRRIGWGYDLTARKMRTTKRRVYRWFKDHRINVERPQRVVARLDHKKAPPKPRIDYDERWRNRSQERLAAYFTAQLWLFYKHGKSLKRMESLVGCYRQHFLNHIASQFHSGMSFTNYGTVWELDHRIPQCAFNLRDPSERKLCYYYPNIQPMLRSLHRKKSVKCFLPVFLPPSDFRVDPAKLRFPLSYLGSQPGGW